MVRGRLVRITTVVALVGLGLSMSGTSLGASAAASTKKLTGTLVVTVADNFAKSASTVRFGVRTRARVVPIDVPTRKRPALMRLAGRKVVVQATIENNHLAVRSAKAVGPGPDRQRPHSAIGTHRIALVLLRLNGQSTDEFPVQTAQNALLDASNSVKAWFAEASSGAMTVTGQVFGWYPSTISACPANGDVLADALNQAAAKAAANGYVASNFDSLVVYTPAMSSCNYGGIGYEPGNGVHINGELDNRVAVHELGHNLGLGHAGTMDCHGVTLAASCTTDEYGDHLDAMGDGFSGVDRTYQAWNKAKLGWLPADEVRTVTDGTQTITLTSSETPVPGSTELIQVPLSDGTQYAIERRESHGQFDQGISGVWLRIVDAPGNFAGQTYRLDMQPSTATPDDGNLAPGMTFSDPANKLTISTLSDNGTTASIQVVRPPLFPPSAPRSVFAIAGNARAMVRWRAPATNGGTPITSYAIVPYVNGVAKSAIVRYSNTTAYTITKLTNGKSYTFAIRARNAKGASGLSTASAPIIVGAPFAPGAVTAKKSAPGSIKVTFKAPPANNGAKVTSYVALCVSTNGGTARKHSGKASPITVSQLTKGKKYKCVVAATNSRGTGPASTGSATLTA